MAIICDIDNTILRKGIYPMQKTIDTINKSGMEVYLVTGRMEAERAKTVQSLKNAGVIYKQLLMNSVGPDMAGQLRSKRVNASRILRGTKVSMAIDDDPYARTLYKTLGIANVTGP